MTAPKQKLKQETAAELITGIEKTFGRLTLDLAATDKDHKAPKWITPERDTFSVNWKEEIGDGLGWLNPPDEDLTPWAQKCAEQREARFLMIHPAEIDSYHFWEFLLPYATPYALYPRMGYQGKARPLILSAFNVGPFPADGRLRLWNWMTGLTR